MTATYEYDGTPLARVRHGEVEFTQHAESLQVGSGRVVYDDAAGTLATVGQMDFAADEDDCTNPITFRGFVGPRQIGRLAERTGTAREITFELKDLNAMAGFRLIRRLSGMTLAEAGKRPAETMAARGAWLMASPFVDGLFIDNGRCDFPTDKGMDEADYRGMFPGDVIADMQLAALGYNAYIRDFGDGPELVFRNDNASTADTSDVRISNVIADVNGDMDGLTFYPFRDAVLTRDPDQVISHIRYGYAKGNVNESRDATATAFNGERSGTASNANLKTAAKAREEAQDVLWHRHTEEDNIECTIQVPSSAANLINHGDRLEAKFSHLTPEGYGSFTWFRVVECTKKPLLKPVDKYEIRLRLSPQEAAPPVPPEAYIVQSVFGRTTVGTTDVTFPNPVGIGNYLVYLVSDRGGLNPPAPSVSGSAPNWGTGAWTKLPNTTNRTDYVAGCAIWYKVADSANATGRITNTEAVFGCFEIAGATITGASTLDETEQPDALTMNAGSFTSATDGSVMLALIAWSDQRYIHTPAMPGVAPTAGFTTDIFKSSQTTGGGIVENSPFTWIGHAAGTGATQAVSITRSDAAVLTGVWMAVAILLEPA